MDQLCRHGSFSYEIVNAAGTDGTAMPIGIVRCGICRTAVGVFNPGIPDTLTKRLDVIEKEIWRISHSH